MNIPRNRFLGPIHEGLRNQLSIKRDEYASRLVDSRQTWTKIPGMEEKHRLDENYRLLFYKFFILCAVINAPKASAVSISNISLDLIRQFDGYFEKKRFIRACRVIKSYIEGRRPLDTTLINTVNK